MVTGERTVNDIFQTFNEDQKIMTYKLVGYGVELGRRYLAGNGDFDNAEQRGLRKTYHGLNKEQRMVVDYLIGEAIAEYRIGVLGGDD